MPISPWLIIAVTVIFLGAIFYVVFAPEKPRQTITDAKDDDVEPIPNVEYTLEDSDVLDIAIRSNESVVANIDALNAAAVGILALPAAFAVFAIDKIRELPSELGTFSLILLALSVVTGTISYEFGYLFWNRRSDEERRDEVPPRIQDAINSRRFLMLYSLRGSEAVDAQVDQTLNTSARNAVLREWKRRWARASLVFFVTAAIIVTLERASAPKERVTSPCSVVISTPVKAKVMVQCP